MSLRSTLSRLAAAVVLTAAAGVVLPAVDPAPASAAVCTNADDITVVVDFNQLGGGVQAGCVEDGAGRTAADLFVAAGFDLSYVPGAGGFVCRVQNQPGPSQEGCNDTPPDTAYWGLWLSSPTSSSWSYSNYGVGSLKPRTGYWIGFAWKQGAGKAPSPRITPIVDEPSAPPSTTPTQPSNPGGTGNGSSNGPGNGRGDGRGDGRGNGSGHAAGNTDDSTSRGPEDDATNDADEADQDEDAASPDKAGGQDDRGEKAGKGKRGDRGKTKNDVTAAPDPDDPDDPDPSAFPEVTDPQPVSAEPSDDDGLPGWVAPSFIAVLFAGAGVGLVVRRRRQGDVGA